MNCYNNSIYAFYILLHLTCSLSLYKNYKCVFYSCTFFHYVELSICQSLFVSCWSFNSPTFPYYNTVMGLFVLLAFLYFGFAQNKFPGVNLLDKNFQILCHHSKTRLNWLWKSQELKCLSFYDDFFPPAWMRPTSILLFILIEALVFSWHTDN